MFHGKQLDRRECACKCGATFVPRNSLQKVASLDCAIRMAKARQEKRAQREQKNAEKAERKERARRRLEVKPLSWWKAKAQAAVNAFIRERDKAEPCISCGRWHDGQWHAGHYLTVGSHPELRFHEDNIHKQCRPCNEMKSGNIAEYRPRLIAKIGIERVLWLEGPHPAAHYTREDCQRIEAEYKAKLKELRNGNQKAIP